MGLRRYINIIAGVLITCLFSRCARLVYGIYGIKETPASTTLKTMEDFSGGKVVDYFILSESYKQALKNDSGKFVRKAAKLMQPLQVRVYEVASDSLIGFTVNCDVGGIPDLKWNRAGFFNALPPKLPVKLDTVLKLSSDLQYLRGPRMEPLSPRVNSKYAVLVYYSVFMNRQSKRLIRQVKKSYAKYNREELSLLFVHSDLLYSDLEKSKR